MYSDKIAFALKVRATVASHAHLVRLNFTAEYWICLIDHGCMTASVLPVSASESSRDTQEKIVRKKYEADAERSCSIDIWAPPNS